MATEENPKEKPFYEPGSLMDAGVRIVKLSFKGMKQAYSWYKNRGKGD
jgi:hypothetical protein